MIALALAAALATCDCPHSKPLFRTDEGLLVCGLPDNDRYSEVSVVDCNTSNELMFIGALHPVTIAKRDNGHVRITEYSEWPFGEHWKNEHVPVFEYDFTTSGYRTKVVIPRPAATPQERQQFLDQYLSLLSGPRPHLDDVAVGKLFALAASGDQKARGLFEVMNRDTHLDVAALEAWEMGVGQLAKIPTCSGLRIEGSPDEVERIINCRTSETILEFDAIEPATAERRGETVHVVQTGTWPFGPHWKWIDVPMFEWTIDEHTPPDPRPRVIMPRPKATPAEIRKMIADYRSGRGDAEEFVGRLFAAAVSGDAETRKLFLAMHRDRHLDGAAGETWTYAKGDLELLGRP